MGSLDYEFLFAAEAWGSADATSQNSSLRCHVPGERLLREAGGEGEPVMLPAGCSQQRKPGETLGRSVAGAGAAVGGGHASSHLESLAFCPSPGGETLVTDTLPLPSSEKMSHQLTISALFLPLAARNCLRAPST